MNPVLGRRRWLRVSFFSFSSPLLLVYSKMTDCKYVLSRRFFPIIWTKLTLSLPFEPPCFEYCTKIHLIRYVNRSTWPLRMAVRRKRNARKKKRQYETHGIERLQLTRFFFYFPFNGLTIFRFDLRPPIIRIVIFLQLDMSHGHRICIMSKTSSRQRWAVYQVCGKAFEWRRPIAMWGQKSTAPTDSSVDLLLKDIRNDKGWIRLECEIERIAYCSIFGKNIYFNEWLGCRLRPTNRTALNVKVTVSRNIPNIQLVSLKVFDEILETVFDELIFEDA